MDNDRTIILVRANFPGSDETEWNDWYENHTYRGAARNTWLFVYSSVSLKRRVDLEPCVAGGANLSRTIGGRPSGCFVQRPLYKGGQTRGIAGQ